MMSNIEQLQLLIKKEQERGDELEEKMANERRFLEDSNQKDVTTAIGGIKRVKHDEGTGGYRNPEKESMYVGGSI